MYKYLLGLWSLLMAGFGFSQNSYNPEIIKSCSHLLHTKNLLNIKEEIDQTPLLYHYDVKFYHLNLNIENYTTSLSGSVKALSRVVNTQLDTFAFELIDQMVVDSIRINGNSCEFYRNNNETFAILAFGIPQGQLFESIVYYHGDPPAGEFFNGVSINFDSTWNKSVVWTLSEPFNARQWWPTKQILNDKADSVWVDLTTSLENKAGSIGLLKNVVQLPHNKVRYEWRSNYPIAYYLISYAVAEYQEYNLYAKPAAMQGDSILIQNYIYDSPGCLGHYKLAIDVTVPLVELFSELYSLYPFHQEKYGHCLTSLSGGMEHQTMTTIGDFNLVLVAHELGHMWFGDNVTCANWEDIWVNEGFATYTDYLAHEIIAKDPWPGIWMNNVHNYVTSQPDGSVYIAPEEIAYGNEKKIFNSRLTYYKGALILHMIRYRINNDDLFFQVFKNYQNKFADSVATHQDFISVLEETTGDDYSQFFEQWFYGEGYPIYNIKWYLHNNTLHLNSLQSASAPDVTDFFNMQFPVKVFFSDSTDSIVEINQTQPLIEKVVSINKGVDSLLVDPDNWVIKKVESVTQKSAHDFFVFTIYPNPVSDYLNFLTIYNRVFDVEILSFEGKKVKSFLENDRDIKIDVRSLSAGIYYLIVRYEDKEILKKFIKL